MDATEVAYETVHHLGLQAKQHPEVADPEILVCVANPLTLIMLLLFKEVHLEANHDLDTQTILLRDSGNLLKKSLRILKFTREVTLNSTCSKYPVHIRELIHRR